MSTSAINHPTDVHREPSDERLLDLAQLREGLEQVLPTALVRASDEAVERVRATGDVAGPAAGATPKNLASMLAAALGTIAPAVTTAAIGHWLDRESRSSSVFPRWFRPRIDLERSPKLATMTSFAHDRSRLVREAIDESTPILISRHGQVLAAIVPLEPGAFESAVYETAGRARLDAVNAAQQEELDDKTAEAIRSASDPAEEAAAVGVDTSDWASLNPPD